MSQKLKTVLVVDDDEGMRDTLTAILKREYRVLRVGTGEAALPVLNREDVDLMLLDVRLPGISGFEVLRIVKENYSLVEVLMISAINEIETAVQAMKHGAYHYITKDFDYDQLRSLVRNASERQDLNRQVLTLSAQVGDQTEREFIVGPSKMTRDIIDLVNMIAKLSATVLILGESGTGKELLARLIHKEAANAETPFIAANPSAERSLIAQQEVDAVWKAVASLSQQQKEIFVLRFREELSLAEIAIPEPAADEVVVRVEASPINPSDLGLLVGAADMSTAKASGTKDSPVITAKVPEAAISAMAWGASSNASAKSGSLSDRSSVCRSGCSGRKADKLAPFRCNWHRNWVPLS